jgi:hypothetical protein
VLPKPDNLISYRQETARVHAKPKLISRVCLMRPRCAKLAMLLLGMSLMAALAVVPRNTTVRMAGPKIRSQRWP